MESSSWQQILLVVACLCSPCLVSAQGQTPAPELTCYACTFQQTGQTSIGEFCGEPFDGSASANVTCDTFCVKIVTAGSLERTQRGCFSDMGQAGACESFTNRNVPGTSPPEVVTQRCCTESFCNHAVRKSGQWLSLVPALLCALTGAWTR